MTFDLASFGIGFAVGWLACLIMCTAIVEYHRRKWGSP